MDSPSFMSLDGKSRVCVSYGTVDTFDPKKFASKTTKLTVRGVFEKAFVSS